MRGQMMESAHGELVEPSVQGNRTINPSFRRRLESRTFGSRTVGNRTVVPAKAGIQNPQ